jgi:hypothetical protein
MSANRGDRRRRNPFDPAVSMTISIPITLKRRLEDAVVARRGTISGVTRQALLEWLDRNEAGNSIHGSHKPTSE